VISRHIREHLKEAKREEKKRQIKGGKSKAFYSYGPLFTPEKTTGK